MKLNNVVALVTGGASGLGESVARDLINAGGKVAILDKAEEKGKKLSDELGENCIFCNTDVSSEEDVQKAIDAAIEEFGRINTVVNVAGIIAAAKTVGKKGPFDYNLFNSIISINLVGTFNVIRLAAAKMTENEAGEDGERGVIINTASIAAFDGQIGQAAYSASKSGIVGMTLPIARDLASYGIRNNTIAPGIFKTPMTDPMPDEVKQSLADQIPFPKRFGLPSEFSGLVTHIIENKMLNGETIRIDGSVRMGQK